MSVETSGRSAGDKSGATKTSYEAWSNPPQICYKMPARRIGGDNCCKPASFFGEEQKYNNRVLNGNWFEERRMYHQLCNRCTGYSLYKTDFAPYPPLDPTTDTSTIPPAKYAAESFAQGEGWNLLRNTEDYCEYLSNYTTTYDLMHNWEVRRAGCKPKPWRKWRPVMGVWLPESDNSVSFGNLTQYGFRKAPILPPVPNDWKTYDMDTEYKSRYYPHKYPENYTLCRYSAPKSIRKELSDYCLVDKPGTCSCARCRCDPKGNTACCPCSCFQKNSKRFSNKTALSTLLPSKPKQNLVASSTDSYKILKHPPHTLPFDSHPVLCGPHSCDPSVECAIGKCAVDVAEKLQCPCR